jgi:hypothetical protein
MKTIETAGGFARVTGTEARVCELIAGPAVFGGLQVQDDMRLAISSMTKANDTQIGGDHYKEKSIQPWDFIAANQLGYFEGNIVKYVSRWKDKGGLNDLKKARHYLDKLIELEDNAQ